MVEVKEDTKQSELPWGDDSYVDALRKIRGLDEKAFFETLEHLMSGYFWQFIGDHDESFKAGRLRWLNSPMRYTRQWFTKVVNPTITKKSSDFSPPDAIANAKAIDEAS